MSGFPAPESFEPCAMPPQDRLRLHHLGQIKQIGPNPRDPYQQRPVATVQPQTRRRPPQGDVELMTEKQILGFKPASRLEHVGDEYSEPMQDHKHRSESCDDSASRRESAADGIFGNDNAPVPRAIGTVGHILCRLSWAGCITNISGFDLRQGQDKEPAIVVCQPDSALHRKTIN